MTGTDHPLPDRTHNRDQPREALALAPREGRLKMAGYRISAISPAAADR
jgi:hypothetical protein